MPVTWDIRGALSSGPQLHRLSFSTDLREMDVIQGGEKKLAKALCQLIDLPQPKAAFVYSTCIVGVIGGDVEAVCRQVSAVKGIPVLPVHSAGFRGTKREGYRAACEALLKLVGTGSTDGISPVSVNILGDFNIAGEVWIIRDSFEKMGVQVVATITGDGRVDDIRRAHGAALNLVQCSGSMMHLATRIQEERGIPFKRVSYFGIEDIAQALYDAEPAFFDGDAAFGAGSPVWTRFELSRPKVLPARTVPRSRLASRRAGLTGVYTATSSSLVARFRECPQGCRRIPALLQKTFPASHGSRGEQPAPVHRQE